MTDDLHNLHDRLGQIADRAAVPPLDVPGLLTAGRVRRRRRRLVAAAPLAAGLLAVPLAWTALAGDGDQLAQHAGPPRQSAPTVPTTFSCDTERATPSPGETPPVPTNEMLRADALPDEVWQVVVEHAPEPPSAGKPALADATVGFGQDAATGEHLYRVGGQLLDSWCGAAVEEGELSSYDTVEGEADGWAPGTEVIVRDRRPEYYALDVVQRGIALHFGVHHTLAKEHPLIEFDDTRVAPLREWAQRVAAALADDGPPQANEARSGAGNVSKAAFRASPEIIDTARLQGVLRGDAQSGCLWLDTPSKGSVPVLLFSDGGAYVDFTADPWVIQGTDSVIASDGDTVTMTGGHTFADEGVPACPVSGPPFSGGIVLASGADGAPDPGGYPLNENGQTYGSGHDAALYGTEPDLIEAIGTNGERGYVLADDIRGTDPRSPEEAVAQQNEREGQPDRVVPLYEVDGVTVIGQFQIAG